MGCDNRLFHNHFEWMRLLFSFVGFVARQRIYANRIYVNPKMFITRVYRSPHTQTVIMVRACNSRRII